MIRERGGDGGDGGEPETKCRNSFHRGEDEIWMVESNRDTGVGGVRPLILSNIEMSSVTTCVLFL